MRRRRRREAAAGTVVVVVVAAGQRKRFLFSLPLPRQVPVVFLSKLAVVLQSYPRNFTTISPSRMHLAD